MDVLERIEAAQVRLGVICKDQRFRLRAGVPASTDDDDVYLSDTLNIARDRIAELERKLKEANARTVDAILIARNWLDEVMDSEFDELPLTIQLEWQTLCRAYDQLGEIEAASKAGEG